MTVKLLNQARKPEVVFSPSRTTTRFTINALWPAAARLGVPPDWMPRVASKLGVTAVRSSAVHNASLRPSGMELKFSAKM